MRIPPMRDFYFLRSRHNGKAGSPQLLRAIASNHIEHRTARDGEMLKILLGVVLGYLLFTSSGVRQTTADILRFAADALAPVDEDKDSETLRNRLDEVLKGDQ